jgi:hypothetical protein
MCPAQIPRNASDIVVVQSLETPLSLFFSTPIPQTVRFQKHIKHNDRRSRHPEHQSWRKRLSASGKAISLQKHRQLF